MTIVPPPATTTQAVNRFRSKIIPNIHWFCLNCMTFSNEAKGTFLNLELFQRS